MKPLEKLYIDRAVWCRGDVNNGRSKSSAMVTDKGSMCCLGFIGKACGIKKEDMLNVSVPYLLEGKASKIWPAPNYYRGPLSDYKPIDDLVAVNDSLDISESTREKRITSLMKKAGVKVTFYGK